MGAGGPSGGGSMAGLVRAIVLAACAGVAGAAAWCGPAGHRGLALRGGGFGGEAGLRGWPASALDTQLGKVVSPEMAKTLGADGDKAIRDLLDGPITLEQAEALSQAGVIKGSWGRGAAESEEEPTSDLEEAAMAGTRDWPEQWGGEEENDAVIAHARGPVRVFSQTKYNRDTLPVGDVKPETVERLKHLLEDDNAYAQVTITEGNGSEEDTSEAVQRVGCHNEGLVPAREMEELSSDGKPIPGLDSEEEEEERDIFEHVGKDRMDQWMDEVSIHNRFKGRRIDRDTPPDLDAKDYTSMNRRLAEKALDQAILREDAAAVESAMQVLKKLEDDESE